MGLPDLPTPAYVEPRYPGVKELNISDDWRARWETADELPEGPPATHVYGIVVFDGRGYLARPRGAEAWDALTGEVPSGERLEAAVRRLAGAQVGAHVDRVTIVGYMDCRATSSNSAYESGVMTVRPFVVAAAKKVADTTGDPAFERRRMPINEFILALRARYPEFYEQFGLMVDRYLTMRSRGEVR
jgi:hypothetical protein